MALDSNALVTSTCQECIGLPVDRSTGRQVDRLTCNIYLYVLD